VKRLLASRGGVVAVAGVVALAIAGAVIGIVLWQSDGGAEEEVPVTPLAYELRLLASNCDEDGNRLTLTGQVGNISQETFLAVGVVGLFADATNRTLARAIGELGDMYPGDIKDFALSIEQADVQSCAVQFLLPNGRRLRTDEAIIDTAP
jgi:hypothetical protein